MKIPIYLGVETDNVDRALVTAQMRKYVIPELCRLFAGLAVRDEVNTPQERQAIAKEIGPFALRLMTDIEAMERKE